MELLFLVVVFGLMWALLIRPQQRRVRQHQALVSGIQAGDEVVTAGGIVGRVVALEDEHLRLEVSPGVQLRMVRGAVSRKVTPPGSEPSSPEAGGEPPA